MYKWAKTEIKTVRYYRLKEHCLEVEGGPKKIVFEIYPLSYLPRYLVANSPKLNLLKFARSLAYLKLVDDRQPYMYTIWHSRKRMKSYDELYQYIEKL